MAAPTAYTEPQLADYMFRMLGQTATALGLEESSFDEAVNDALLACGVDAIADATDIPRLRALARREAWRLAAATAAGEFDFSTAGSSFSRSQLRRHVEAQLKHAEDDALAYDAGAGLSVSAVFRPHDPYVWVPDTERIYP